MLSLSQVRPCRSRKEEAAIAKLLPCAPGSAIPGSSALDSRRCAKSLVPLVSDTSAVRPGNLDVELQ